MVTYMGFVDDRAAIKNFLSIISIKKRMQNILKKGSTKIKIKKLPVVRVHYIIKPVSDFAARPKNRPSARTV